jgi:hypothetical protein
MIKVRTLWKNERDLNRYKINKYQQIKCNLKEREKNMSKRESQGNFFFFIEGGKTKAEPSKQNI